MLWRWDFGNISLRPSSSTVHSWPALLLLQTPNPAVSQHSSEKCVYGLLTSTEWFQSLGVSFHFQVSAQVNTAIRASTICRDSPLLPWQVQKKKTKTTHDTWGTISRGIKAAPCWLLCTGRRTSVCLKDLRTLLERSSGCSHVRPELQDT